MGRFKLILIFAGVALGWYGFKEWRLSGVAKAEAQVITCAALAKDGYGENAHVKVKDFLLSPGGYVYEEEKRGGGWAKVWIPVVPSDGPYAQSLQALAEGADIPAPKTFRVILQSEHIKSEREFGTVAAGDYMPGVVINEIDSLDRDTEKLLEEAYPGIDLDACWIVEHRRKTPTAGGSLGMLGAGVVLIALGVWLFIRGRRKQGAAT